MSEYQCWFCGNGIDRTDTGAVMISIGNLWRWDSGAQRDDDPWQSIYVHSECAKDRMRGPTMTIEPSVFDED